MIAGLRDFAEFIPLKENLFDLIIIDEASQVSIAQALPALLRSKKMIVMGDRRQFGNVKTANASKALNQAYFSKVREEFSGTVAHGDIALKKIAKCISNILDRDEDYLFRLGGEEFGALYHSNNEENALRFAENIRVNIERLKIEHKKNSYYDFVTISLGLIILKNVNTDMKSHYKQADNLLYEAKNSGKNNVKSKVI